MSGVLKVVGQVAGLVASVAAVIPGGQPIAAVATVVATAATIGAQLTAKKPRVQGSASGITIGATMASPCLLGETYFGGCRVKQVGYGTADDVPNAYAWVVDVYSVAGPVQALVSRQIEFSAVSFTGTAATGYYADGLWSDYQLGATPEADALAPQWAGAPGWDASSKISGKAAIGWSALWPKNGKMFGSGFPQTGAVWQGIKLYDPRLDSTYPGGSGAHRWADPITDPAGHETAKATWQWTGGVGQNHGLHALRYALGSWERDETGSGPYFKVFGIGLKPDQIVMADFVELANVCDANGWTVNGVLREGQGISKWDNLKRILGAASAEPVWKGGRLGVRVNAPRIALDTITMDDIAEGEPVVPSTRAYEDRKNTLIPKWVDPASKWELVPSTPVTVAGYVAEDGEERSEEWALELVTNADQAAQVTGYELVGRREQGPIMLPLKPRLRAYPAGTLLNVSAEVKAEFGIRADQLLLVSKTTDLGRMSWHCNFVSEDPDKHTFALGLTGATPPPPYIPSGENRDEYPSYAVGNNVVEAADEAEMLALDVPRGTLVYRTDTEQTFYYNGGTSGTIADWTLLSSTAQSEAADVSFAPAGNIAATDVQAAIQELDTEKVAKSGDTMTGGIVSGVLTVNASGVVTAGESRAIYASATISGTAGAFYALKSDVLVTGSGSLSAIGYVSEARHNGTATLSSMTAISAAARVINSGAVTTAIGVSHIFILSSSGNLTTARNFWARSPSLSSTGTITTAYGLLIDAQKVTGVTTGYAIDQIGTSDIVRLAGSLQANGDATFARPVVLPSYAKASLPSAATYARGLIYVPDEVGGAIPAFSDGTNWLRVTDRAVVS